MKKNKNTEASIFLFRKMWEFSEGNRRNVVLYIILSVIAFSILLLEPAIFGMFLNELQTNWMSEANIVYLIFLLCWGVFIAIIFWLFHWFSRYLERRNAFKVLVSYKKHLFNKVLNFDISWHTDRQSGDSIDKVEKATRSLFTFSENSFEVTGLLVRAVGSILALIYFNAGISLGIFIALYIGLYIIFRFDMKLIPLYKKINSAENKISAKIYDSLSNITSIIILNIKNLVIKDVEQNLHLPEEPYIKRVILNEKKRFFWDVFFTLTTTIPLIIYLLLHYKQHSIIEIWTISALYMYLTNLSKVFFSFGSIYSRLIQYRTDIENAEEIENTDVNTNAEDLEKINLKKLELVNAWFSYKGFEKQVIDNLNLEISAWEKIALIWKSGSWKTTFLKLLHWLHSLNSWKIVINWKKELVDLSSVDLQTMLVPQEPELFAASIRENVTFWIDVSEKELDNYIRMACFDETVEQLPNGLESKVNEKWVNLSGWQKQRLALARALLFAKKKKIILFDESTSSVDPENEMKIYKNILKEFDKKTIISSIHKMNLLKFFDRIIMFENWKIVDDGSFESLLKNNKSFENMWKEFSE